MSDAANAGYRDGWDARERKPKRDGHRANCEGWPLDELESVPTRRYAYSGVAAKTCAADGCELVWHRDDNYSHRTFCCDSCRLRDWRAKRSDAGIG